MSGLTKSKGNMYDWTTHTDATIVMLRQWRSVLPT